MEKMATLSRPALAVGLSLILIGLTAELLLTSPAVEVREEGPCGPPPPPKPQQRAGGESFPPLPLPVTPLRRTEKKRPPSPPVLIAKLAHGDKRDWLTDQNDINNLLGWLETELGIKFGWKITRFNRFSFNPRDIPILYISGHYAFNFNNRQCARIRKYLEKGGTLWLDACCGREEFRKSALRVLEKIFPDKRLKKLDLDHPLFSSFYEIKKVRYKFGANNHFADKPYIQGINIGCRTAVIYTKHDLSCGWDFHTHASGERVEMEDALHLGANMVAYAVATKTMGMSLSESRVYLDKDKSIRNKFLIGQVIHQGDWNPKPSSVPNLLDALSRTTAVPVSFEVKGIELSRPDLFTYPFIYMTGHWSFKLTADEAKSLRKYLLNGGFLFANACCGRESFDLAFRREISRVLSEFSLSSLPVRHPIYNCHHNIRKVQYTPAVKAIHGKMSSPKMEGITINGNLAVAYSPYALGCGWAMKPCPYCKGYSPEDSLRLGTSVILYALTH